MLGSISSKGSSALRKVAFFFLANLPLGAEEVPPDVFHVLSDRVQLQFLAIL
jgi:hypothetical protein